MTNKSTHVEVKKTGNGHPSDTGQCRRRPPVIAFARHPLRCPKDEENQHDEQIHPS